MQKSAVQGTGTHSLSNPQSKQTAMLELHAQVSILTEQLADATPLQLPDVTRIDNVEPDEQNCLWLKLCNTLIPPSAITTTPLLHHQTLNHHMGSFTCPVKPPNHHASPHSHLDERIHQLEGHQTQAQSHTASLLISLFAV